MQKRAVPLTNDLPDESAVGVITIGELRWGVLNAGDDTTRSRRLDTCTVRSFSNLFPVDDHVAAAWTLLRQQLRAAGAGWVPTTHGSPPPPIAHGYALVTQDAGFPEDVPGLTVIRV